VIGVYIQCIHYNTGLALPKFSIDITGFYVNVKLLIYSMSCHQDSCTNQDNLQQQ